ncbi:dynein light intermediate chain-domain-containing protein [Glomus cerebriforme]|uniref:Dynein light intermediate chain-domain-containing protein n=1 Tax=Glomus cerebriforme TaxID=658196 RepID=A0A397TEH2_9GLOM|nr:dynein light intermediate chain-domain-containing protein [Glomus cerebriforme]
MAPKSGEISLVDDKDSLTKDNSLAANETEEIWSSILKGVASSKIVPTKSLLILGDRDSGKSALIRHLKGVEDEETFEAPNANGTMSKSVGTGTDDISSSDKQSKNDLALSYTFVEVKDDEAEDTLARLGIYQLAGSHDSYQSLLRFALNSSTLPDSLVVIVLDWARPWTFIETLQRWIKFLEVGIEGVKAEGDIGAKDGWTKGKAVIDELKESIEKFIQNYVEPDSNNPNATVNSESDDVVLELGPGVLTSNLAVPLVVVCAKSDNVSNLERDLEYKEEQFDYIQQSLRTICLKYGAALFYTSTRQPQTFTNLRKYILHRLLGRSSSNDTKSAYSFNIKANYVERDTVLVPTGWDSWTKIKFLKEGFDCDELLQGWDLDMGVKSATSEEGSGEKISAKKVYEETIVHEDLDKPLSVQTPIEAEDEQDFFQRHFETLQRANNERPPPPSVVGPMGAPSYPYGDIGADIPDLDNHNPPIPNTIPSRPKQTNTIPAKISSPSPGSNTNLNGSATAPPTNVPAPNQNQQNPNQNEVLATFFQNLLSKKTTASTGASQTSSNEPAPLIAKQTNRKMVEKELVKMKNPPSTAASSMAGK